MNRNVALCLLVVALVLLASVPLTEAECEWLDCHTHISARDWCNVLGPGWKVNTWRRCDGLLGRSEQCCK